MTYVIGVFLVTIIITIVFILWAFNEYDSLKTKQTQLPFMAIPPIIERAYRAVDFKSHIRYIPESEMRSNLYHYDPKTIGQIVVDSKHKEHIIRQNTVQLAEEMLKAGCIEINERQDLDSPYMASRIMQMKVKVYKPGF